jgi:arsenite methyltransferase
MSGYGRRMTTDRWADWLLRHRDGGSAELRDLFAPQLLAFRDGVLGRAAVAPGDTLLDVGTGTGLIGLGALDLVGPSGHVIFSDVSPALLDECRRHADPERSSFVEAGADDLSAIPDASADVVTTRSVLIYVTRKAEAFAEFRRVLRPGGRLSIFEPINSFPVRREVHDMFGLGPTPVADLVSKVRQVYTGHAAMVDFDERDLLGWAVEAGFTQVTLDYRAEVDVPGPPIGDWAALKRTAPNPLAPTYGEAIEQALTPAERDRLDACVESLVGTPTRHTMATAYLSAVRS